MNPLPALAVVVALTAAPVARAIEEPRYAVEQQLDAVEVRAYAPYVVAEVVVPGPAEDAGNQGFRILAAYIFGKNKGERKIAMTAPVTQTAAWVYLGARILYVPAYYLGWRPGRSAIWAVGFFATLTLLLAALI